MGQGTGDMGQQDKGQQDRDTEKWGNGETGKRRSGEFTHYASRITHLEPRKLHFAKILAA
jgi:hypothetical protein